jgi:phosphatidylglycerophosphate synthase
MTAVIIVAFRRTPSGEPACLLPAGAVTLLERLVTQFGRLDAERLRLVTRPEWRELLAGRLPGSEVTTDLVALLTTMTGDGGCPLLIDGEVVVNDTPLRGLLAAGGPAALVGPVDDPWLTAAPACTVGRERVLMLAPDETATHRSLGVARLDRDALVAGGGGSGPAGDASGQRGCDDPLLAALDRALLAGSRVRAVHLRGAGWHRPSDADEAADAVADVEARDEEALRLAAAVKAEDGWFTTHLVSPYSRYVARWAARRGFTPDQVTVASLLVGVAAATAFATGMRPGLIVGAVLLQAAFTLDCVDGQLARYAGVGTARGGWLDAMFDRLKEYLVYAGLAIGAVRVGEDPRIWQLAVAALVLQTVRHHVDLGYEAAELDRWDAEPPARRVRRIAAAPAVELTRGSTTPSGVAEQLVAAARRMERAGPLRWAKRIIVLPIGERFALISLVAAVAYAQQVFVALLVWGGVALAYTATGRLARTAG